MQTKNPTAPLLYKIGINKPQAIRLSAYGTVLCFLAAAIFSSLSPASLSSSGGFNPIVALAVYVLTLAAHEAVHGFFFKVYGGRPKFGVALMYHFFPIAYATSPGQPYSLAQMLVIGMSPLVVLCALAAGLAVAVPSLASYAAIVFVGNFAGAVGDMWLARQLLRFKGVDEAEFVDLKSGIAVYGRGARGEAAAKKLAELDNPHTRTNQFVSRWLTAAAVLLLGSALLPLVLSIAQFQGHILVGPGQFPLFEFEASRHGASFTFNPVPVVVAGLIYAVLYDLMQRFSGKRQQSLA